MDECVILLGTHVKCTKFWLMEVSAYFSFTWILSFWDVASYSLTRKVPTVEEGCFETPVAFRKNSNLNVHWLWTPNIAYFLLCYVEYVCPHLSLWGVVESSLIILVLLIVYTNFNVINNVGKVVCQYVCLALSLSPQLIIIIIGVKQRRR